VLRHGVLLADLGEEQRRLALEVVRATLSARGYEQSHNIMRINGLLASITSSPTEYDEWYYFISIFGTPSADEPWGW
jgi:hypothetical protein